MKKVLFCLFLILFFCGCGNENIRPVEVLEIKETTKPPKKIFSGIAIADMVAKLAFRIGGEIKEIYVTSGDYAKKGQILARIDNELYEIEVSELEMRVKDAIVKYENAKKYADRINILHSEGGISDSDWDKASTSAMSAKYQIQIAKDRLAYARKNQSYSVLIAPYDGQVVQLLLREGTYVSAGEDVIKFQGGDFSYVQIFVSQNYINRFYTSKKANVTFDAIKNKNYKGEVKSIAPSGDSSYVVKIKLDKNYPEIKAGMSAYAEFDFENERGIFIPLNALMDNKYVWIVENNKLKKREVTIARLKTDEIRILKGLNSGDFIVIKGISELKEDMKVKINE